MISVKYTRLLVLVVAIAALGFGSSWVSAQLRPGEGRRRGSDRHRPRVHADVPLPAETLEPQMPYFYGRSRIEIPGAVTLNQSPYVCDLDRKEFASKQDFAAHLRIDHAEALADASEPFVVRDGQVHFVGK